MAQEKQEKQDQQIDLDGVCLRKNCGYVKKVSKTVYEQKPTIKLCFQNRLNEAYDVLVEDIPESEYHDTVADKIARALDPNQDKQTLTYGMAKSLAPKTALINKMKADIDEANRLLYQGIISEQEAIKKAQEAEKLAQVKKEPKKEEKGDPNA